MNKKQMALHIFKIICEEPISKITVLGSALQLTYKLTLSLLATISSFLFILFTIVANPLSLSYNFLFLIYTVYNSQLNQTNSNKLPVLNASSIHIIYTSWFLIPLHVIYPPWLIIIPSVRTSLSSSLKSEKLLCKSFTRIHDDSLIGKPI